MHPSPPKFCLKIKSFNSTFQDYKEKKTNNIKIFYDKTWALRCCKWVCSRSAGCRCSCCRGSCSWGSRCKGRCCRSLCCRRPWCRRPCCRRPGCRRPCCRRLGCFRGCWRCCCCACRCWRTLKGDMSLSKSHVRYIVKNIILVMSEIYEINVKKKLSSRKIGNSRIKIIL